MCGRHWKAVSSTPAYGWSSEPLTGPGLRPILTATTTILGLPARAPPIAPAEAGADDVDPDLDPEYA